MKCVTLHGLIFNSRIQSDIICTTIARKIRACETSNICALLTKHEIKMTSNCQSSFSWVFINRVAKSWSIEMCCSRKCPYPQHGHFCFKPLPILGGACHNPLPVGISVIFHLGWVPSGKNISLENAVVLYLRNIIVSAINWERNLCNNVNWYIFGLS